MVCGAQSRQALCDGKQAQMSELCDPLCVLFLLQKTALSRSEILGSLCEIHISPGLSSVLLAGVFTLQEEMLPGKGPRLGALGVDLQKEPRSV